MGAKLCIIELHVEAEILSTSVIDYLVSLRNCFCNLSL